MPCRPPPFFYMAQCDGGPPAIGLGAPDQGVVKAPLSRWAQGERDLSNSIHLGCSGCREATLTLYWRSLSSPKAKGVRSLFLSPTSYEKYQGFRIEFPNLAGTAGLYGYRAVFNSPNLKLVDAIRLCLGLVLPVNSDATA
jgi:hypothetical protein